MSKMIFKKVASSYNDIQHRFVNNCYTLNPVARTVRSIGRIGTYSISYKIRNKHKFSIIELAYNDNSIMSDFDIYLTNDKCLEGLADNSKSKYNPWNCLSVFR